MVRSELTRTAPVSISFCARVRDFTAREKNSHLSRRWRAGSVASASLRASWAGARRARRRRIRIERRALLAPGRTLAVVRGLSTACPSTFGLPRLLAAVAADRCPLPAAWRRACAPRGALAVRTGRARRGFAPSAGAAVAARWRRGASRRGAWRWLLGAGGRREPDLVELGLGLASASAGGGGRRDRRSLSSIGRLPRRLLDRLRRHRRSAASTLVVGGLGVGFAASASTARVHSTRGRPRRRRPRLAASDRRVLQPALPTGAATFGVRRTR